MNTLQELINQIKYAKEQYYTTGRSPLTDLEYDKLVSQAEKLGYIETVGSKPVKEIPEIKHEHPMLSLDKVHSAEEVEKFIKDKDVVLMYKADGLSISCTYNDGVLTRLETRGDGNIGNDVLFHANSFENLPKVINKPGKYVIDGECVILQSDFDKLEGDYSNPRNLAAGSLNQLDPNISKTRHLRFYAWDVIEGGEDSLFDNLAESHKLGFETVECLRTKNPDDLNELLELLRNDADESGFPIDGVVIRYDSNSYGKSLGSTGHHPRHSCAYKFEDEKYITYLRDIIWQCGKSGVLTPVAIFDDVVIDNTVVNRASLSNISVMKQTLGDNPFVGQQIWVAKMNMIIPKIVKALDEKGREIIFG